MRHDSSLTNNAVLIETFLTVHGMGLAHLSRKAYHADLHQFARQIHKSLLDVQPHDLSQWISQQMRDDADPDDTRPCSVRTMHRRFAVLRKFYGGLHRDGRIKKDPTSQITLPRFTPMPPHQIGGKYVRQIIRHLENTVNRDPQPVDVLDLALIRLMDGLALRVSEAVGLRLSGLRYYGRETRIWVHKKGGRNKYYPIVGVVRRAMTNWLDLRRNIQPLDGHDDFIFLNPIGNWRGHRVTRQRCWLRLKRLAADAGLPGRYSSVISPHALRHSRARKMLDGGDTLASVQAVLDHANISTTSIYLQCDEQARLRALRRQSRD